MFKDYVRDVTVQNGISIKEIHQIILLVVVAVLVFGAQQSYHTKKNSVSTMGQFSFKTKKEQGNFFLEKDIVEGHGTCHFHFGKIYGLQSS